MDFGRKIAALLLKKYQFIYWSKINNVESRMSLIFKENFVTKLCTVAYTEKIYNHGS